MRLVAVAADVVMGVLLGLFVYAAVARFWPTLKHPVAAAAVVLAVILVVLFRRNGSLAVRHERR
jgi:hypothetical protein